ncbi:MAG: replicative DNA helicase [Fibromonadaceae bacterium]|jgi:replicative DNA helicase|nr:replicative DNA helicase [Fibromonadaceae bacterium]
MQAYNPREYPQAIDAEVWLLGSILQDPKSLGEISLILRNGAEFYHEKNQAVWSAMLSLYKDGNPIDVITVSSVLERDGKLAMVGGKDYIFSLMETVSSAANSDYYAELIRNKYILRSLISSSNETIKESLEPSAITEEVLQSAEKRIFDLITDQIKENAQQAGEVANEVLNMLAMRRQNELSGCPTDFREIDSLTNGLQKTDLIILAARPSMGKTALALNIASNAAMLGKTVLFFSLEMNAMQLVTRVLSSKAGIDQSLLRHGKGLDSESSAVLRARAKELGAMPLFIDDSSEVRAFDLLSKCRIFKRKHNNNLDLVVVDYLQMMKISGNSENRAVGVAENSRMLKVLAKELQVPVLALAQLNRNVENRHTGGKPQLSDLRDSGSIEQDADMVWFIHRPAKEKEKSKNDDFEITEEEKRKAILIIAKHRNGPTANINLEFHGEITTFKDAPLYTSASHPNDAGFSGNYGG